MPLPGSLTAAIHCIKRTTDGLCRRRVGRCRLGDGHRKGENMERHDIDDQLSTTGAQELLASRRPPTSPTSLYAIGPNRPGVLVGFF
jgi:hypothetical protein